jgi:hypothetical protein
MRLDVIVVEDVNTIPPKRAISGLAEIEMDADDGILIYSKSSSTGTPSRRNRRVNGCSSLNRS